MVEGSDRPFAAGITHVGRKNADGTLIKKKKDLKLPYELHFESDWTGYENAEDRLKWYVPLKEIPEGSELFKVYAWSAAEGCEDAVYE